MPSSFPLRTLSSSHPVHPLTTSFVLSLSSEHVWDLSFLPYVPSFCHRISLLVPTGLSFLVLEINLVRCIQHWTNAVFLSTSSLPSPTSYSSLAHIHLISKCIMLCCHVLRSCLCGRPSSSTELSWPSLMKVEMADGQAGWSHRRGWQSLLSRLCWSMMQVHTTWPPSMLSIWRSSVYSGCIGAFYFWRRCRRSALAHRPDLSRFLPNCFCFVSPSFSPHLFSYLHFALPPAAGDGFSFVEPVCRKIGHRHRAHRHTPVHTYTPTHRVPVKAPWVCAGVSCFVSSLPPVSFLAVLFGRRLTLTAKAGHFFRKTEIR